MKVITSKMQNFSLQPFGAREKLKKVVRINSLIIRLLKLIKLIYGLSE